MRSPHPDCTAIDRPVVTAIRSFCGNLKAHEHRTGTLAGMTDAPDITVSELRAAMERILDAVADEFGEELRFPGDFYWHVPVDGAFALDHKPKLDVGQVADDAESVHDLVNQPEDEFVSIWHECGHLAGLLQAIEHLDSTRLGKPERPK